MEQYIEFLIKFSPLVAAHLVVPPLSYFYGERCGNVVFADFFRILYSIVPPCFLRSEFVRSLLTDRTDEINISPTSVTHLFVHSSYDHLFGNLKAALQLSYPVYNEFGTTGLYFLFLTGGVFASLPTFLRSDQKFAFSKLVYDRVAIQSSNDSFTRWIPDKIVDRWNTSVSTSIARKITKWLPTKSCGSSGAACALMGCDIALLLRDFYNISVYVYAEMSDDSTPSQGSQGYNSFSLISVSSYAKSYFSREYRTIDRNGNIIHNGINNRNNGTNNGFNIVGDINTYINRKINKLIPIIKKIEINNICRLYNLINGIMYCCNEINTIYPVGFGAIKITVSASSSFLDKACDLFSVGHSEHLQGIFYGASFAVIFGFIVPFHQRRQRLL